MEIKLIELYCLICHLYDTQIVLKHQRLSNNSKPCFTDQELVTCYFFGMLNNHYQQQKIYDYIANHWRDCFPALPTYQAFNNRLNNLAAHFAVITDRLLSEKHRLLDLTQTEDSLIDSFPVMLKRGKNANSGRVAPERLPISVTVRAKTFIITESNFIIWRFVKQKVCPSRFRCF